MIGRTLSHYRVLRPLGSGGMGVVYEAEDLKLGRKVALKMIADHFTDRSAIDRFEREARSASALNHPNICTIYEIDEIDGRPFLAMELLEGETLQAKIASGTLSQDALIDLAMELADALSAAHAARILHRDLKPANLFLTHSGHLKILDFGLAKLLPSALDADAPTEQRMTASHITVGTMGYMSPEQLRGEQLDARSDLYSFGVVLGEAAGSKPGPLAPIIAKATEKDRELRYQSAADIRADLRRLKQSGPSPVAAPSRLRTPIIAAAIAAIVFGAIIWTRVLRRTPSTAATPAQPAIHSLAVLPFKPIIAKERDEALEFGIADTLIAKLSNVHGIAVRPLTAVRGYAGLEQDAIDAGKQLGVDAVLDGTTHNAGGKIRVTARLLRVSDAAQLWSGQFDTTFADIFSIYDAISTRLAGELSLKLTAGEEREIRKRDTDNPDAYRAYLLGRNEMSKLGREQLLKSVEYFKQAVALDPGYSLAYVGLANVYMGMPVGADAPSGSVADAAKDAASKAIALNPELPDGYTAMGIIKYWYDWDWPEAEKLFRRSIDINPNFSRAHLFYSTLLSCEGRHEEAIRESEIAQRLEPLWIQVSLIGAQTLLQARRYDEAIAFARRELEPVPDQWVLRLILGKTYSAMHQYDEALKNYRISWMHSSGETEPLARIGEVSALKGDKQTARQVLADLTAMAKSRYVPPYNIAVVEAALGENDRAIEMLNQACRERDVRMVFLRVDPSWDAIRSRAAFGQILKCGRFEP